MVQGPQQGNGSGSNANPSQKTATEAAMASLDGSLPAALKWALRDFLLESRLTTEQAEKFGGVRQIDYRYELNRVTFSSPLATDLAVWPVC